MKKLNLGNINAGLSTIKELANENAGIARDELIDVSLIDFANKNTYAANDTDDSIRDLADQIETVGLLNPLGVIQSGNRYKLFSGERRYRAITQYLHWDKIPCRIFEGVSAGRAQLMNGLMKTPALSVTNPMVFAMSAQTECSAALSFSVRFPLSPIHPVWPFV